MSQLLQGVIFDMDGLMFDTERLSARCWEQVGRKFGLDITESFLAGVRGVTSQEFQGGYLNRNLESGRIMRRSWTGRRSCFVRRSGKTACQ